MLIGTQTPSSRTWSVVCIPNSEIRSAFREWISKGCAKTFWEFVLTMIPESPTYLWQRQEGIPTIPLRVLLRCCGRHSSQANVDPQYSCWRWSSRYSILLERDHSRGEASSASKKEGVECMLLSCEKTAALKQCNTRHYRALMLDAEYGLAFLGHYCGVEARIIEWLGYKGRVYSTYYYIL
jgi:hypothetical protein